MSRFSGQVNERLAGGLTGNPIPGVTVYVYEWDYPTNTTGALTALTDDDLVTPLLNPLTTDEFGQFYFNADIGVKLIEYWFGGKLLYREQIILTPAGFYPGNDAALRADLATASGSALVGADDGSGGSLFTTVAGFVAKLRSSSGSSVIGFDEMASYPVDTVGHALRYNLALTPADFAELLPGGTLGVDDTAAFVALAAAYNATGRAAHIPDLGFPYRIQANSVAFIPPASYNSANKRPPAITSDASAVIQGASGGSYLIKLGSLAGDYSGFLRSGEFDLPVLHDGGFAFTKGVLYVPFFTDCRFDHRIVCTVSQKGAQFGDTAAPAVSAGVKGNRDYEWDFHAYARTVQSITNAVNPVVTFAASHGLWPSSGNRVACLDITGTLGSWAAINGKGLDCTILSATQIQLKNVDTTTYGALPGTTTAYLNFPSSRVPKQISGVTNANPAVITTATAHLLTSGDTVDIAEIFQMPSLIGQYVATVLSSTTFSIPVDTTSTATWGTWTSSGPGWAMQWVAPATCDIAEYHDNATDIDDSELYSRHFRIHQYHNPATCGYDGKHQGAHFYNFPEAGEMLCAYYLGGDNDCVQIQCDGPFRYVFWATGPRNASTQCSTNVAIAARDQFGCLVRTESLAGWASYADRLKADTGSHRMFSEHVGLGTFACRDTIAVNVAFPLYEMGPGNRAASVRFVGSSAAITQNFQVASVTRSSAGVYVVAFTRAVPLECNMLVGAGTTNAVIAENEGYGSRTIFQRQITCQVAGVATDPGHVNLEWRFP
jgi:hypothetical protein